MISVAAFQNRARTWLSENAARFAGFDPADPQAGRAFRSALWDAGLQTRALKDGNEYVINGQKVWTSGAQQSDYALCMARTNPDVPKHQGLSMFIVDLKAAGVTIRPLRQMTGDAHFNEVFLDEVR